MKKDEKRYLIVESVGSKLTFTKNASNEYILEGIFAEFGVKNNNDRIYEENEYLPHLKYLQEKIEKGNLFGEVDHPDRFEVKLDRVSHVVEELVMDERNRTLKGRIRLLSTPQGQILKNLVDDGIQISISSRSAGTVNEKTKKVSIQQIFAYDAVAEGGFAKSPLHRVNESLGIQSDRFSIYDVPEEAETKKTSVNNKTNIYNNINKKSESMAKSAKLTDSKDNRVLAEHLAKLHKDLNGLRRELNSNDGISLNEKEDIKKYLSFLTNQINESLNDNDRETTKSVRYSEYLSETLDKTIDHSDHIAGNVNELIELVEHLSAKIDNSTSYSDYLSETLNGVINHVDYLAENLDHQINYSEYIGENVDHSISHVDSIVDHVNNLSNYNDYIAEKLDQNIRFTEYGVNELNKSIEYSDYLADQIPSDGVPTKKEKNNSSIEKTNENLSVKVDTLIDQIRTKQNKAKDEIQSFPYKSLLKESRRREFSVLPMNLQHEILNECKRVGIVTEQQFIKIWEGITNQLELEPYAFILEHMPAELKPVWQGLNEGKKEIMLKQSEFYKLNTPAAVRDFWDNRPMLNEEAERFNESKLFESVKNKNIPSVNTETNYNDFYKNKIKRDLNRYKK